MTSSPPNSQNSFSDSSIFLPSDPAQQTLKLTDSLRDNASAINSREIGQYLQNELITGSVLYGSNAQKTIPVYRKTVPFGPLPNTTSKSVPHGISVISGFQFFKLYAVGNNPSATGATAYAISIPDENSTLTVTSSNVVITTTIDYSAYTNAIVVLEYAKST